MITMLFNQAQRRHHTMICLAAVLIYHCFSLLWRCPIMPRSIIQVLLRCLSACRELPCTLLLWRHYNHHYPFMPLGQFNVGYFALGLLAIIVLNIVWQFWGSKKSGWHR
jgi:hypothetical protein